MPDNCGYGDRAILEVSNEIPEECRIYHLNSWEREFIEAHLKDDPEAIEEHFGYDVRYPPSDSDDDEVEEVKDGKQT